MVALPLSAVTNIPTFDAAVNGDPDPPPTLSKDGSRTTDHRNDYKDDKDYKNYKAFLFFGESVDARLKQS